MKDQSTLRIPAGTWLGGLPSPWSPSIRRRRGEHFGTPSVGDRSSVVIGVSIILSLMYVLLLSPTSASLASACHTVAGKAVVTLACHWGFVPLIVALATRAGEKDYLMLRRPKLDPFSVVMMVVLVFIALMPLLCLPLNPALSVTGRVYLVMMMCSIGTIEELLFRGFVRRSLAESMPEGRATLLSTVLFAVAHVPQRILSCPSEIPATVAFAFMFGLIAAAASDICESNVPNIACHCAYDSLLALM